MKTKSGMSVTTPLCKRIRFDIEPICQDANKGDIADGTMQNTLKVLDEAHQQQSKNHRAAQNPDAGTGYQNTDFRTDESPTIVLGGGQYN